MDPEDESLQTCLARELKEELGVEAIINKDVRFVLESHKDNTRYIELIWGVNLHSDPISSEKNIYEISGNELSDVGWFKKNDLKDVDVKPDFLKNFLDLWLKKR